MKKIIQLTEDKTKAFWKWEWDEKIPLAEMFSPEFVGRMVDVTGMEPEPQSGWDFDGKKFTPPIAEEAPVVDLILGPGQGIVLRDVNGGNRKRLFLSNIGELIAETDGKQDKII